MTVSRKRIPNQGEAEKNPWELIEVIGKGTYGEVYRGKNKRRGEVVAVKVTEFNQNKNEELKTELAVLEKYSHHENIIKFIDAQFLLTLSGTEQLWIITEFCEYGAVCDLVKKLLKSGNVLNESLVAMILSEVLKGLQYLHDSNVIHRDIKGSNILLNADARVKLIDFGVSTVLQSTGIKCRSSVGTPFWMAPEVIACEQQLDYSYDSRCDIWSLGITAIELADGDPPLVDQHPMRALFKIPRSPPPTVKRPEKWTGTFLDFLSKCLVKDFEKRPFVGELIGHAFIEKVQGKTQSLRQDLLALLTLHYPENEQKAQQKLETGSSGSETTSDMPGAKAMVEITNLAQLENLNEETILSHLREGYSKNQIYTYLGDILIAINPFKELDIYNEKVTKRYQKIKDNNEAPHVFQIARAAHLAVLHKNKSQCCVISGESGAGKTVTSNYLVEQLAALSKHGNPALVSKILQVNPLMEAFGNAATNINENSSRFGKFLELSFTHTGDLIQAQLSEFLLEKSRVVHQSRGERNFHVLYYLIAGLDYHRKLGNFDLNSSDQHRYLNTDDKTLDQFACTPQMQEHFLAIQKCFDVIGFSQEEVQSLYCILAAVIHLGDIEIAIDDSMSMTHHGERGCIQSSDTLNTVASLLCVRPDDLADAITSASAVTRGETILRYNTVEQSCDCRDATAKALYSRLFSWIVKRINILLGADDIISPRTIQKKIGILDIFGFENFAQNSFEQLCINIANEQLQFYFNQHVFEWEFEEYASEGVRLDTITFQNNRPILEMFLQRPMGILALLDEESRFPRATVFSLVEKFCDNMSKAYFRKPKDTTSTFIVQHYAGQVSYDASGFLEKNRDTLSSDVMQLLRTSDDRLVRTIFQGASDLTDDSKHRGSISSTESFTLKLLPNLIKLATQLKTQSNSADGTIVENKRSLPHMSTSKLHLTMSLHFRNSLRSLMAKMIHADPHFIRCIRPNSKNVPDVFDDDKVMTQLHYTGVLETSKIRRQGYSERINFGDFVDRYKSLVYHVNEEVPRDANTCRNILKGIGMETNWRIGKTKVFLKYFQITKLAQLLEEHRRNAVRVQRFVKAWLYKVRFKKQKAVLVQSAVTIQKHTRGWIARRYYAYMKTGLEMQVMQKEAERGMNATKIQSGTDDQAVIKSPAVRGYLARKRFKKLTEDLEKEAERPMLISFPTALKGHDEDVTENKEDQVALQDTKMFFFLAQIQMSTADVTPPIHRTNYPVLYSLRRDATEKARKEAVSQKIGSRERVLAVLDGTDDTIQSKYRWAREQFETKTPHAKPSQARPLVNGMRASLSPAEMNGSQRESISDDSERSRSSSMSYAEHLSASKSADRLLSNYEQHEKTRKRIRENRQVENIEDNVLRTDQRKGYPLRSLMERNVDKDTAREEQSDFSQFQWFTPRNAERDSDSYLARETSISTEEKVHRNINSRARALQSVQKTAQQNEMFISPNDPYDHRPYSYLQNAQSQRIKKETEQVADHSQQYYPNYGQHVDAAPAIAHKPFTGFNGEHRKDIQAPSSKVQKSSYLKEKGMRDPLNRVLPRTDVDMHEREDQMNNQRDIDNKNTLASQIASHLAAQKSKAKSKQPNGTHHKQSDQKHGNQAEDTNNERSLTSIENKSKLKQVNGFNYGITNGPKGTLHDFNLRKTGRLQMLVKT